MACNNTCMEVTALINEYKQATYALQSCMYMVNFVCTAKLAAGCSLARCVERLNVHVYQPPPPKSLDGYQLWPVTT